MDGPNTCSYNGRYASPNTLVLQHKALPTTHVLRGETPYDLSGWVCGPPPARLLTQRICALCALIPSCPRKAICEGVRGAGCSLRWQCTMEQAAAHLCQGGRRKLYKLDSGWVQPVRLPHARSGVLERQQRPSLVHLVHHGGG